MRLSRLKIVLLLAAVISCTATWAQNLDSTIERLKNDSTARNRLITRATLYGFGFTQLQDTYLSPQEYKGFEFRVSRESVHATRLLNNKVSAQSFFQGNFGYTHNKVDNNNTATALLNWNYALHYNFDITDRLKVLAGGATSLNGGFTYNMRNGNNPFSLRAYTNIEASLMAKYDVTIRRRTLNLRYQVNMPLVGAMFMPHYGQSYYEIFSLGNAGHTVRMTTPFSQPSFRQMLTADYPVGKTKIRFAYVWDTQQAKVNNIKTHVYSHVFMIGVVKELFKL